MTHNIIWIDFTNTTYSPVLPKYWQYVSSDSLLSAEKWATLTGNASEIIITEEADIQQPYRITDHINVSGENPLIGKNEARFGPRFPDMSHSYRAASLFLNIDQLETAVAFRGEQIQFKERMIEAPNMVFQTIISNHQGHSVTGLIVPRAYPRENLTKYIKE